MIKRLIFDIDGTLIVGGNIEAAIIRTLKKLNIFSDNNFHKFLFGISDYEQKYNAYNKNNYLNYFRELLGIDLPNNFLDVFFEELKKAVPQKSSRIASVLKKLSQQYELVILSNYFSESQKNRLHSMNIDNFFLEWHGERIIKPNAQAYFDACGNHLPEECVMIGDNIELDIKGALDNGLQAIFINSKEIINPYHNVINISKVEDLTIEMIDLFNKN